MADTYKEVRTFKGRDFIVRVHIPDLTAEEHTKRMKAVYNAAANLLRK